MKKKLIIIHLSENLSVKIVTTNDINKDYIETLADRQSLKYMGNVSAGLYNYESLRKYICRQHKVSKNYLFGLYKDKYLVATSRVHDMKDHNAWQGVLVFKKFQNQGNGILLVKTVSDYILKFFGIDSVYAGIAQDNFKSQKLFSRCGFIHVKDDLNYYFRRQIWMKNGT